MAICVAFPDRMSRKIKTFALFILSAQKIFSAIFKMLPIIPNIRVNLSIGVS